MVKLSSDLSKSSIVPTLEDNVKVVKGNVFHGGGGSWGENWDTVENVAGRSDGWCNPRFMTTEWGPVQLAAVPGP